MQRGVNIGTVAKPISLGLKIKKGKMQDATFIHSDPGYANADKPRENGAKIKRYKEEKWTKKVISRSLDTSFIIQYTGFMS